jgi:MoaA/NifB/PqqE/SkfB family radical SAM enzyme
MTIRTIFDLTLKNLEHGYYKLSGQRHRIVPYKIVVELTTQCNSKCLYCDIWKIKKEDLQKIDLNDFENFLKKMNGHLLWLALTGGEISTNNQFPEIIELIKKNCPNLRIITFTTNGLMPQRILEFALLIRKQLNCDTFITISLDGDEQTHDTIRGIKGNYAKCMETYELLKAQKIPAHFGITVADGNYSFIKQSFYQYRDRIKAVTFVHTGGIFLTKEGKDEDREANQKITESLKIIYQHYKISSLGDWLIKSYIKIGIVFLQRGRNTNVIPCDVGLSSAHLMANGDLLPCMYLPPISKLGEGFEVTDYHSPAAEAMLEEIKRDKCPHCWMSCYGPHNMLQSPLKSLSVLIKPI